MSLYHSARSSASDSNEDKSLHRKSNGKVNTMQYTRNNGENNSEQREQRDDKDIASSTSSSDQVFDTIKVNRRLSAKEIRLMEWEEDSDVSHMSPSSTLTRMRSKPMLPLTSSKYPYVTTQSTPLTMSTILTFIDVCGGNLTFEGSNKMKKELEEIFTYTPMFALAEDDLLIHYRNKLGEGAFCNVYPVHVRNMKTGKFNEELPPLALKQLKREVTDEPGLFTRAYDDLAQEAEIMKSLQHKNIIQMFGMSNEGIAKQKFFVLVEKLQTTLDSKLEKWSKIRGPFKQTTPKATVNIRIDEVALAIAKGMEYLHSQHFIYRDLKPANIGFDQNGCVKIFDFGLAIQVPKGKTIRGKAGTLRYMAPEMRHEESYNYAVDVYSFSILLWQIITSRTPFEKEIPLTEFFVPKDLPEHKRPNLKYIESKDLTKLLQTCWTSDPDQRLKFSNIVLELQRIVEDMGSKKPSRGRPHLPKTKRERPSSAGGLPRVSSMNNY